jgi:competence ComEA-like helix-hairpin-helix protein
MWIRGSSRSIAARYGYVFASQLSANKKPPLHPTNLNTATALELQQVSGVDPSTRDKILKMCKSCGPFKSLDDLLAVKGIGPKHMEKCANTSSWQTGRAGKIHGWACQCLRLQNHRPPRRRER